MTATAHDIRDTNLPFEVRPLDPIGAEIVGVDLSEEMDDETFDAIWNVFHRNGVIVLRDQELTPEDHMRFGARFGTLEKHFAHQALHPDHPELLVFSNIVENGKRKGGHAGPVFHTDVAFDEKPILYSALYAVEVPHDDDGNPLGDTLYVRTDDAYDRLDDDLKQKLAGRKATQSYKKYVEDRMADYYRRHGEPLQMTEAQQREYDEIPDRDHPLFRTHPVTGRKSIYCCEGFTRAIEGMDADESRAMVKRLCDHIVRPEYVYTHKWRPGDILVWDNCATLHCATSNYRLPQRRLLYRCSIRGEKPI